MIDEDHTLITSSKSQRFVIDGYPFSIEIFRLDTDKTWTLEVVDQHGTSHVWEAKFASDKAARDAAIHAMRDEGPLEFMRGSNIIPFRRN